MIRRAGLGAIFALLLTSASVSAATTKTVDVTLSKSFVPTPVKVVIGDSVKWHNAETVMRPHTATADQFAQWNVFMNAGATSPAQQMHSAGSFTYHCTIHPQLTGTVKVRLPTPSFSSGTYTIRVGNAALPSGVKHEIQFRKGSAAFSAFGSPTTAQTVSFHPINPGRYQFRTRLTNGSTTTGWSPLLTINAS